MLADNIKRLIKKKGYTQNDLALRTRVTASAMSRYVSGEREPRIAQLKRMAAALGVTVDELIKDCGGENDLDNAIN